VWILTGDKDATANQIGLSCGVLSPEREIYKIESSTDIPAHIKLGPTKDVLIAGQAIAELFADESREKKDLVDGLINTKGLVVYRASPSQKASLVTTVRKKIPGRITLAIGDGANDVNMI